MPWEPISEVKIRALIGRDLARATDVQRKFFEIVAVPLTKWVLHPWGDRGGGFWAVSLLDDRVLWYNDIEDGFNVSRFAVVGTIPEDQYWCYQDELRWALNALAGRAVVKLEPAHPVSDT